MPDNPNQPQADDAVLGGQNRLFNSAVLGGIAGVKRRLKSAVEEQRIAALKDAIKYGEVGLDLVIRALDQEDSWKVEKVAYLLLRERVEPRVKQVLREYEYNPWAYFECLRTLNGHTDKVNSVAISPDGQILVSGSADKTIKVWNLQSGELIRTLREHSDEVNSISISVDGQNIVSGSGDTTIRVWNLQTKDLFWFKINSQITNADGQIDFYGIESNTIRVWNEQTEELIIELEGHTDSVNSVAISPDGQILVSGSNDKTIKIWGLQ